MAAQRREAGRIGVSLRLLVIGSVLGTVIGVVVGAWGAIRQYRVSDRVSTVLSLLSISTPTFVLANLLILVVGCFIDTTAAITILVPILLPIVLKLGIDPIHFGLIMVLNLMIGLLHPPMGMVLFVLAAARPAWAVWAVCWKPN